MGAIELPQLGEGRFQRSPHPPERSGLLLKDLIFENVEGSAMTAKIAGHGLCIAPHGSHPQHLLATRPLRPLDASADCRLRIRLCPTMWSGMMRSACACARHRGEAKGAVLFRPTRAAV